MEAFAFHTVGRDGRARAGILSTPHGKIQTPVFAPVGTQASVKAVTPVQLEEIGVSLVLANTYHLNLRPGAQTIADLGGLHDFMQWPHPILTDSGGYQVFSLQAIRQVDDDGVTFKSHLDGMVHRLTPEKAVEIQEQLGADIIMALDECPRPEDHTVNEMAMRRTNAWAERALQAQNRSDQALFGIVQGGIFQDLREVAARFLVSMSFFGYAVGGLSVGEKKSDTYRVLEWMDDLLPEYKPRYLMGVGTPKDLVEGVARGMDMFDCVLPTRLARHHSALLRHGRINLLGATLANDPRPIQTGCLCYTCQHFSRAYIRHLMLSKEILGATLVTIHNLQLLMDLIREVRKAIIEKNFSALQKEFEETDRQTE